MTQEVLFSELQKECIEFLDSCDELNCFTRSTALQKTKISECQIQIKKIKLYKQGVILDGHEDLANELFFLQCLTNSLKSCLEMWIELKNENFTDSWSSLIDSQEYAEIAKKIRIYEGLEHLIKKLEKIEDSLFPKWALYNSPSFIETIGECSICQENFLECDHLENEIYMGSLCQRVNRKIKEVDHAALVYNPRDRRCIITAKSNSNGKMIDYFTSEEIQQDAQLEEDGTMKLECILFSTREMDFS